MKRIFLEVQFGILIILGLLIDILVFLFDRLAVSLAPQKEIKSIYYKKTKTGERIH